MVKAVRLSGNSIAYLYVSVRDKEMMVWEDQVELYTKMQEIYNEQGLRYESQIGFDTHVIHGKSKATLNSNSLIQLH